MALGPRFLFIQIGPLEKTRWGDLDMDLDQDWGL